MFWGARGRWFFCLPAAGSQGLVETVDAELSWSNDTRSWARLLPGQPLIPRTPWPHPTSAAHPSGPFDSYIIFAPAYPVLVSGALHLVYGSSDGPHTSCPGPGWDQGERRFGPRDSGRRCRKGYVSKATLRPDGFAGWRAPALAAGSGPADASRLSTAPQVCSGDTLILSLDVHSTLGFVKASIRIHAASVAAGSPLEHQSLLTTNWSLPVRQNITDGAVVWAVSPEDTPAGELLALSSFRGQLVVVDLLFSDATVYAFGFADRGGARA